MAGQEDRPQQRTYGLGNTLSETRERLGEGREGSRRRRRGVGQSRLVGIHGILNPQQGIVPGWGSCWQRGAGAACPGGGQLEGSLGGTGWPQRHSPPAARETWSVFPKIHVALAVFVQAPATSCQEPVNGERFFNDGAFNHNDQFVSLSIFKDVFFLGKRLKPFFNEM